MEKSKLHEDAEKIADLILKTDTDDRGILFEKIAEYLSTYGQGYTAKLFKIITEKYEGGYL